MPRSSDGFTLIELIMVIVLLGIVATITTSYLGIGASMYADAAERERLLSQSRFAIERITRELRNALPNSVRVSADQQCIEFVPLLAAGRYEVLPGQNGPAANNVSFFTSQPYSELDVSNVLGAGGVIIVYPTEPAHYYNSSSGRQFLFVSASAESSPGGQEVTLNFGANVTFSVSSPNQRFFLWNTPVRYCVLPDSSGGSYNIYRFTDYGILQTPPLSNDFATGTGVLMAEQLVLPSATSLKPFTYTPGVLTRSSVVHVILSFSSNFADDLFFNQEIHIPNVP